jgi:photosystem II stability/assembly factor-like uncharacterized protein
MVLRSNLCSFAAIALFVLGLAATAFPAQGVSPALFSGMRWRLVGPFRGGRTLCAVGVPGQPNLFYMGAVGGGVWKTTDAGNTWQPIFDGQPIASIGDLAVAPSNPVVIYVGSGEADMRSDISYGDGMYKSVDGGRTWQHIGLTDTQQIGRVLIDPKDPNRVFVAALGHAYGANDERGVFRTSDGGATWQKVLFKNADTGAIDLAFDPHDSNTIYAALWQTRRPPWNVYPPSNGPGSGLYKSTDGGNTWQQLTDGLPTEELGRIGIAVAASDPERVYAIVDAKQGGLYRSDDAGKTWHLVSKDRRIWLRGWYFGGVSVDPKNADVVYLPNIATYKSTDGGKTFTVWKGSPGGDDYHSAWISPEDSSRVILSSDQGTVITLNGGETWSSWYNQPTAQFYHVVTDNQFPYWLYGAQQDSGAMAVPSRSNFTGITEHDWHPVEVAGESGMIATNPLDPRIVFGGDVTRFDTVTTQDQDISPTISRPAAYRRVWTLPVAVSKADPHKLYFANQFLSLSVNGGQSWEQISPDLTRAAPPAPPNLDPITEKSGLASPRKGVIYAIAPSPLDANMVWVGTDDGTIHVTRDDGRHWSDVTPKELTPWSKVGILEASHFDRESAYAAIDRHRLDDLRPYIYRTHDGGKTWQLAANGIPTGAFVNVVREDPVRRGLLYAGTELGMYVSFDDGDHWQPLQLNLPVASVRDIDVHGDDLAIATHGRSFWILDDLTPLRQATAAMAEEEAHLFRPAVTLRVRPGHDQGTPRSFEVPHGENPPAGAILDYYLKSAPAMPVALEILDARGKVVRRFASDDKPPVVDPKTQLITMNWVHVAQPPSAAAGGHRFVWDLRYPSPGMAPFNTPWGVSGVWAPPGSYTVRLTVDGKSYTQPLVVMKDPRVKASDADLEAQFAAAEESNKAGFALAKEMKQVAAIEGQLTAAETRAQGNAAAAQALARFRGRFEEVAGPKFAGYGPPVIPLQTDFSSLRYLSGAFRGLTQAIESADAAPTAEQLAALKLNQATMAKTMAQWQELLAKDLPALNAELQKAGLGAIDPNAKPPAPEVGGDD